MKIQNILFAIGLLILIGCGQSDNVKHQISISGKRRLSRTAYHLNSLGDTIQVYPKVVLNNITYDKGDWLQDSVGNLFYINGGILILK